MTKTIFTCLLISISFLSSGNEPTEESESDGYRVLNNFSHVKPGGGRSIAATIDWEYETIGKVFKKKTQGLIVICLDKKKFVLQKQWKAPTVEMVEPILTSNSSGLSFDSCNEPNWTYLNHLELPPNKILNAKVCVASKVFYLFMFGIDRHIVQSISNGRVEEC